jgi:hypothetical protein
VAQVHCEHDSFKLSVQCINLLHSKVQTLFFLIHVVTLMISLNTFMCDINGMAYVKIINIMPESHVCTALFWTFSLVLACWT